MIILKKNCYLCNSPLDKNNKTKDHVIPRCLFSETNPPKNLITIPCCVSCQKKHHDDEEYFRNVLTMQLNPEENDSIQEICNATHRSFRYRESLRGLFLRMIQKKSIRLKSGLILPNVSILKFSVERSNNVISKITRGLLFKHTKIRIDDDYEISIYRNPKQILEDLLKEAPFKRYFEKICSYAGAVDDQGNSIWWLTFFQKEAYIVIIIKKQSLSW